jgi:E3 ubiquitin-protein ligase HERC2
MYVLNFNKSMFQPLTSTALSSLVKGLPEALQRQYEYEDPIVRSGKHLMHSPFFKVSLHVDFYKSLSRQ